MKLYQYPNCSTCRKAIKFLNDNGIEFTKIDITEQPPKKIELRAMLASYDGEIRKLFNTSGVQYRELNMKEKLPAMSAKQAIDLLAENGKLIKRPFLLNLDREGIVGFKEADWEKLYLMAYIDCFNGDADGICALAQVRLHNPVESELITGVKRDINLMDRVSAKTGDIVTVLDVSLDKNRMGLEQALARGAEVFYCDHHYAGEIPDHPKLNAVINTTPDVCTSLLINKTLKGRFLSWAVVGTFGDNLSRSATALAKPLGLDEHQLKTLQNLGIYINYNGYGAALEDLYFEPAELFKRVVLHSSAQEFIHEDIDTFGTLESGYRDDMEKAAKAKPSFERSHAAVFQLPNQAWARRVSGVFGNDLANQFPDRAHAVITEKHDGHFLVSVRAPLSNKHGADKICRQFATGGGRSAAAGINDLPSAELNRFIDVFSEAYQNT